MRILTILFLMVTLTGTVLAQPHMAEEGAYRLGASYKEIVTIDAQACAMACGAEKACKAWNYQPRTRVSDTICELKGSIGNRIPNPMTVTGISPQFSGYAEQKGAYRLGASYREITTEDSQVCAAACNADQRCASWNYLPESPYSQTVCELKENVGNRMQNPLTITGLSPRARQNLTRYSSSGGADGAVLGQVPPRQNGLRPSSSNVQPRAQERTGQALPQLRRPPQRSRPLPTPEAPAQNRVAATTPSQTVIETPRFPENRPRAQTNPAPAGTSSRAPRAAPQPEAVFNLQENIPPPAAPEPRQPSESFLQSRDLSPLLELQAGTTGSQNSADQEAEDRNAPLIVNPVRRD